MLGSNPHLSNNQTQTTIPIWQAPLPFNLISADIAGQLSALGAVGMIYVAPHTSLNSLRSNIETYSRHHEQPSFCFYHRLPVTTPLLEQHAGQELIEQIFAQATNNKHDITTPQFTSADEFTILLDEALASNPRAIGFAHGLPEQRILTKIKKRNCLIFAICHSVAEAVVAEDQGVDIIVLQGNDAGGLHSHFSNHLPIQPQSAMSLLKQAREHLNAPIVLWGDFPQGKDIVAALISGASAVMFDRPLLSCDEANLTVAQKEQIATQNETHSLISDQFSTLPMRLLPNFLTNRLHSNNPHRHAALDIIMMQYPQWRPLCVSPTQCSQYRSLSACLEAYREDILQYLA